jgi:ribosomal protein S18 acetylase RimI-like enzyme
MTIADYDSVVRVWTQGGLPYRPQGRDSRERIARELESPETMFLVAESAGEIVGVVLGTHDGRKMWANRLAVLPSARRVGVATALVRELERWADAKGLLLLCALVEAENGTSRAMMERLGYARHDDIVYYSKRKDAKD